MTEMRCWKKLCANFSGPRCRRRPLKIWSSRSSLTTISATHIGKCPLAPMELRFAPTAASCLRLLPLTLQSDLHFAQKPQLRHISCSNLPSPRTGSRIPFARTHFFLPRGIWDARLLVRNAEQLDTIYGDLRIALGHDDCIIALSRFRTTLRFPSRTRMTLSAGSSLTPTSCSAARKCFRNASK